MVSGVSFWAALAVLVVLTAAGLRYYLPLARRVLVVQGGRVEDQWVTNLDGIVGAVLVAWFVLLGYDSLTATGEQTLEFGHVVSGATIYASLVIFLIGLLVTGTSHPPRSSDLAGKSFSPSSAGRCSPWARRIRSSCWCRPWFTASPAAI